MSSVVMYRSHFQLLQKALRKSKVPVKYKLMMVSDLIESLAETNPEFDAGLFVELCFAPQERLGAVNKKIRDLKTEYLNCLKAEIAALETKTK